MSLAIFPQEFLRIYGLAPLSIAPAHANDGISPLELAHNVKSPSSARRSAREFDMDRMRCQGCQ